MEGIDEFIYGDNSIHKLIRASFSNHWEMASKLYQLKFDLRHIKPKIYIHPAD